MQLKATGTTSQSDFESAGCCGLDCPQRRRGLRGMRGVEPRPPYLSCSYDLVREEQLEYGQTTSYASAARWPCSSLTEYATLANSGQVVASTRADPRRAALDELFGLRDVVCQFARHGIVPRLQDDTIDRTADCACASGRSRPHDGTVKTGSFTQACARTLVCPVSVCSPRTRGPSQDCNRDWY